MKRYLFAVILISVLALGFESCKPDEEIYNPKCKISKIWYRSEVGEPDETYIYDKHDRQLQQIVMENGETYDFTYNKDKSIQKIVHVGTDYTEEIAFTSTKRLVDKMTYTIEGQVRMEMTVTHDEETKRISKIEQTYDRDFYDQYYWKKKSHPLYDKFFGDYDHIAEISSKCQAKDLTLYSVKNFTYDPGKHKKYEDISTYVEEFPIAQTVITHTIEYDKEKYNPFYGMTFAYAAYAGYHLHCKSSEKIETVVAGSLAKSETLIYSYEGLNYMNKQGFPRQFITISSLDNVPVHTYILYKK